MIVPYQKYYRQGPDVLRPDDAVVLKVCAVRGWDHDWAAYKGLSQWSDEQLVESGDWYVPQGTSSPKKRRLPCSRASPQQGSHTEREPEPGFDKLNPRVPVLPQLDARKKQAWLLMRGIPNDREMFSVQPGMAVRSSPGSRMPCLPCASRR